MHRVDIPGKVTGGVSYVQDMLLPGMLHARVVRPPAYGAVLVQLLATASAVAQALWLAEFTGVSLSLWQWAALQGCIATFAPPPPASST